VVNLYQIWEHFYFEPGLFVHLFIHSVTQVTLDTSITDYNLYVDNWSKHNYSLLANDGNQVSNYYYYHVFRPI